MARAERHNADYFPFLCKEGNNTKYIEATYGNDGFAVWVKVLRQLTVNNYHYIDLSIKPKLMTFSSVCKVKEEVLIAILNDLAELEEIDKSLWYENRIIWSDKFIENIQDAYKNRKTKITKKKEFLTLFESLAGKKLIMNCVSSVRSTHTIEEKTIEEKTIEEEHAVASVVLKKDSRETNLKFVIPFRDEIKKAWDEWEQYRKEKKQSLTPSTIKKQIQFLGGRGDPEIIAIINQSIINGWTGLFELKNNGQKFSKHDQNTNSLIAGFQARYGTDADK